MTQAWVSRQAYRSSEKTTHYKKARCSGDRANRWAQLSTLEVMDIRVRNPSAFDNGAPRARGQKSLLVNYLTDSIHVKC